ncbi:hypothetical protein KIW84_065857 [Lathyrus oleraceus]|uniref:Arabidopsis retrotransposon Orf1 C-terminal domain-containing protein n=1 Tax=Pisum sativum TaxID=3888 RepID=A0A9D5A7Y3_PEA|nr:hypothetical protein KIW84_065857 [Pisum sativum]
MEGNQNFGNIIFRSEDDNYQREQFERFQQRGVTSTRYPDSTCLQQLGLLQGIEWMLRLADLTFLCTHNQPTYPSLTLEFLSSYAYNTPTGEDEFLTGTATFRMFNTEYSLSQNQLSTMLQFPIEGQVYPRIPPNLNWNTIAAFDLFRKISGVDANNWEELLVSNIHNPTIRYFIRILQNTGFGRPNNNKVNAKELFFLECVFEPNAKVNAASFLFHHIRTLCARGRQPFVIGGLITTIALGLNLGDRIQTLESLPPLFMDISYCRSSRLIKNRVGGKYYLMVNNQAVPSVVLPNIALTDVTNPNRHLYDLNAPEATEPSHTNPSADKFEEMEQGDNAPAQQSVPLNPSDTAAGPSSRRRRRRRPATNDDIMDAIDGGQGPQENSASGGDDLIPEDTDHRWGQAKSQLPTIGDIPTILGDMWLDINKIFRRRTLLGILSRNDVKIHGEQPPNRYTSIKHYLLTAEETSLLKGERTICSAGEGNNTSSSKSLNTGRYLRLGGDTNYQARIGQPYWGWTASDHTEDKLLVLPEEMSWMRETETNPSSTRAMAGMKREISLSPTALGKLPA